MSKLSRRVIARTVAANILAEPKRMQHWLQVTAAYLIEHNQTEEVDLLVNDIAHEVFEQSGRLFVDVTSARPLTDDVRGELKRLLSSATDAKSVDLTEHVDPTLLGGLVARTPSGQLDVSVRSKLRQLATLK